MQSSYQVVRVFDKPNIAEGNQAAVFLSNGPITLLHNELISLSADVYKNIGIATTCFTSELGNSEYEVQCFNNKSVIQCCGHGMIAAAKKIFIKNNVSKIIINKDISATQRFDKSGQNVIELVLPRLLSKVQNVPDWVKGAITFEGEKRIASHSAKSKNVDGYLLLEFSPMLPTKEFHDLQIDIKKICENTKRAVVVIQFNEESKSLYMRYFAPQYGVVEDSATGSVMRFVGDYIEKKYLCDSFDVHQCSKPGGYMKVKCMASHIVIKANTSMELN